ncbi:juvenile hormone esterase-like [Wyeomyia smithii]|uniref:juvenile hormone esterase-like n=1 Tax=Wyeomyia smithii TaxID=174621 RepID=UPI0024680CB0|nr:juvenile hormone esterase-like [Wyeomyia smithii]
MFSSFFMLVRAGAALVWRSIVDIYVQYWPGIERPIVVVQQGQVQGVASRLPNGSTYCYFKGIPYAKPPIGELRFCPPVELAKFSQPLLKCFVDKKDFVQPHQIFGYLWMVGREDALYLNVYTPSLPEKNWSKPYPVMVFIHGGGLEHGTARSFVYDPKYFIQKGVIVVTLFYRLGPFGFLSLPSVGVQGNFGLKDQRLALKWVRENIKAFGGDPENVTLFGESAGSWSAYLHYLSPNSRKYFHRVICQSGEACTDSILQIDPAGKARALAKLLGYKGNSDLEVLETLRKAPARQLAKLQNVVISEQEKTLPLRFTFRPVIEKEINEDAFLIQAPEKTLKAFDTIRMPLIQGYTDGEGILSLTRNKHRLKQYDLNPEWLIPQFMGSPEGLNRTTVGTQIKQFYCKTKNIGWNTLNETRDLFSDITFIIAANLSSEWLAKYQPNALQYHYLFSFDGRFSVMKKISKFNHIEGAAHGDDLMYMFSPSFLPDLPEESDEVQVRNTLVKLWTNFAKYNNPTPDAGGLSFKWTPVTKIDLEATAFNLNCLEINVKPKMIRNPYADRKEFWRSLMRKFTNLI